MKLNNPFSEETRNLFLYVYWCFKCLRSDKGLELHHIAGRVSASAMNACPLCPECHARIGHSKEEERELLIETAKFLLKENYQVSQEDKDFMNLWGSNHNLKKTSN